MRLFQEIDKTNPSLAAECWWFARLAVFREKQYDLAKKYVKSPLQEYDTAKANHDLEIATQTRLGGPQLQHLKQMANDRFIEECLRLIGLATFIGDNEAAQEIRKHAASVVNDPRLQETPQKPDSAGTVTGQHPVTSGKATDQRSGGFHLVRGTTLWLGSIGEPFVYDDYDKHFYMAWGAHIVVLPKPAEGFGDFYRCRTLHPGVGRMAVSDVHSASGQPTNVAMPGAIDLPTYQLLLQPSVQQALKLSDEQRGKLQDISAKYWTERRKIAGKELDDMETSSQGELAAYSGKARHGVCQSSTIGSRPTFSTKVVEQLEEQWSNARKEIEDVLSPEQLRTLKDLTFRTFAFGSGVMFEPEVLDKIGVLKEEQNKLQALEGELRKEKGRRLRSATRDKIKNLLAVLTPDSNCIFESAGRPTKTLKRTVRCILIQSFRHTCLTREWPTNWDSAKSSEKACGRSLPSIGKRSVHSSRRSRSSRLGMTRRSSPLAKGVGKRWPTSAKRLKLCSRPNNGRRGRIWRFKTYHSPSAIGGM